MSFRDELLPLVDECRKVTEDLGQRTTTLKVRTETWSGARVGLGTMTATEISFPGRYHIKQLSAGSVAQIVNASGGQFQPGQYVKLWVTPQFAGGGYTKEQLVPGGADNAEIVYLLTGGLGGRYNLVSTDFGRPYRYELTLRARNDSPPP